MRTTAALLVLALIVPGCASTTSSPIDGYLHAKTLEEALSYLAPSYRIWFGERKGEGMSRDAAAKMLTWDFALHPRHRVEDIRVDGRIVTARVHEDNDFSLLIGFPGWDSTSTYELDESGRIVSQVYVPRAGQPEWRPYLDAPLAWIRANEPAILERIFPNGRLKQDAETAREWVRVLRAWRAATGQSDPTR